MSKIEIDKNTILNAYHALVKMLGKPSREPSLDIQKAGPFSTLDAFGENFHPVFFFQEHFQSNDSYERGYTENHYRGDHSSLPMYSEHGEFIILEISFHKGDTFIDVINYPDAANEMIAQLIDFIRQFETR